MIINESVKARGLYELEAFDMITGERVYMARHNVVVQNFFNSVLSQLNGGTGALNVTHFAIGTGTAVALKADTALQTEIYRKAPSTTEITGTTYKAKNLITASDAVGVWGEVGMVINGTDVLGSGSLLSHANLTYTKSASVQVLVTFTLTIE